MIHRIPKVLVSARSSEMMIAVPIIAQSAKKAAMKAFPWTELPYLIVPIVSILHHDSRETGGAGNTLPSSSQASSASSTRFSRSYSSHRSAGYSERRTASCLMPSATDASSSSASLSKQLIFYIPAMLILAPIFGLDGVLMAGPVADTFAFILCLILCTREIRKMDGLSDDASGI